MDYNYIVSDETSGRLVSLALDYYKKLWHEHRDPNSSRQATDTRFLVFSTQTHNDRDLIDELLHLEQAHHKATHSDSNPQHPPKVLVVTELIQDGDVMNKVAGVMSNTNIDWDVAALVTKLPNRKLKEIIGNRKVFIGSAHNWVSKISEYLGADPAYSGYVDGNRFSGVTHRSRSNPLDLGMMAFPKRVDPEYANRELQIMARKELKDFVGTVFEKHRTRRRRPSI